MDRLLKHLTLAILVTFFSGPATAKFVDSAAAKPIGDYKHHEGEVSVLLIDNVEQQKEEVVYELTVPGQGKRYQLDLPGRSPFALRTGQKVRVFGKELSGKKLGVKEIQLLELGPGKSPTSSLEAVPAGAISGSRASAVILVNLLDATSIHTSATVDQVMWGASNSVQDIYFEDTRGAIDFVRDSDSDGQADIYGPVNVPMAGAVTCDFRAWSDAARAQLAAQGLDLGGRDHYIYVLPSYVNTACNFSGMAELGGDEAWINSKTVFVLIHELGHNLNLHHAGSDPNNDGVLENQYGDNSCFMGASYRNTFMNAPHKEAMGILGTGNGSIVDVPAGGGYFNYMLEPTALHQDQAIDPQVLRIRRNDLGLDYYVSIRDYTGYDANLESNFRSGVSIHWYDTDSPGTVTGYVKTLWSGESFVDSVNGITITQNAAAYDGSWADVSVHIEAMYEVNAPTFALQNMSGQFPEITVGAGEVARYAATLTNNDGPEAPATSWTLRVRNLPAGMTAAFDQDVITLNPGQSATTYLNITTEGAAEGSYEFFVDATDEDATEPDHLKVDDYGRLVVENIIVAPEAPTALQGGFSIGMGGTYLGLDWTESSSADVALYHVVLQDVSGERYWHSTSDSSIYLEWTEGAGTFTFWVVAEGSTGKVSEPSGAVTLTAYEVNAPTFALQDLGGQFPEITVAASDVARYAVKLTNNDGPGAPATRWTLTVSNLPAGMSAAFDQGVITLNPGQSATTYLNVAPNGAPEGTYEFSVDAIDADAMDPDHVSVGGYGRLVVQNPVGEPGLQAPTSLQGGFVLNKGKTYLELGWVRSSSAGIVSYHVLLQDGFGERYWNSTSGNSINDQWTEGMGVFTFRVVAEDASGTLSEPSAPLTLVSTKKR